MGVPAGTHRGEQPGWQERLSQPRAVRVWASALMIVVALAGIVGAALWWDNASLPLLGLIAGAALGAALIGVAWWAWRREYDLPPALAWPSWIAAIGAMVVGTRPEVVPDWAPMVAYGHIVSYSLGCVPLIVMGVRRRQEVSDDHGGEMADRAMRWHHGVR